MNINYQAIFQKNTMVSSFPSNHVRRKGFTLVEISVSALIAFVIFQAVYSLFFSTLTGDKVNEEYTAKLLECQKILIKIQRELISAQTILYPIAPLNGGTRQSKILIYRNSIGIIKAITYSKDLRELKLYTLDLMRLKPVRGDLIAISNGELEERNQFHLLGSDLEDILFSVSSDSQNTIQIRLAKKNYHLLGGSRTLSD